MRQTVFSFYAWRSSLLAHVANLNCPNPNLLSLNLFKINLL